MKPDDNTVGIIGGRGAMGQFFRDIFEKEGYRVIVSGRTTPLSARDCAQQARIVVVSVPIRDTVAVINDIAPFLSGGQILCDLTSIKQGAMEAMLATPAQVLGLHPMFGPGVSSLEGQTVIAVPARCMPAAGDEIMGLLSRQGARVTVATAAEHDRMMAVIQGLMHFSTLVVAETMRNVGAAPAELLRYQSPIYQIETAIIGRILGQDADLYGPILQDNPEVREVVTAFSSAAARLQEIVYTRDQNGFAAFFQENSAFFAPVIPESMETTNRLIQGLVEK
ncbi:prephenate dehydrogenase/arogenate dehydrogenase family protein [Methanogenium organophilum]|uniref:Prephenate dehydrogenase/arogenate dehydrogenase family protein n=1 Tax=Methanogenium organophilum TaxID=2199 RepID=A0A9X9S4N4_METOG|nr:prephenate dehydrogenase/arogenate dehydrogenase family protein [Methanogenium organophilum]WAI01934.1 prephenate dehydrogenase/arogenate dehydrogenase family protein [Methanogenium organophilum]